MVHIVLDLEWNQAPHPARTVTSPVKLNGEIVQLGAVKLNESFEVVDTLKLTVRPRFYKKMHHKVKEITGLTAEDLASGLSFPEAMGRFFAWAREAREIFTWGPDDEGVLRDNCLMYGIDPCHLMPFCNLQLIFDDQITRENRQFSLSFALSTVGETLQDAHDALNDALGTARLCRRLDMKKGLKDYPTLYGKITPPALCSLAEASTYPSKKSALNDPALSRLSHPTLHGQLQCTPWAAVSPWKHLALGTDQARGEYLVCLKLSRRDNGRIAVSRTVHPLNKKLKEQYLSAKKKAQPVA